MDNDQERSTGSPPPVLSAAYVPATEDSVVLVRFAGNTAQIVDFNTKKIDAFQLFALSGFFKMKAEATIAAIERQAMEEAAKVEARGSIAVATGMPSDAALAKAGVRTASPGA